MYVDLILKNFDFFGKQNNKFFYKKMLLNVIYLNWKGYRVYVYNRKKLFWSPTFKKSMDVSQSFGNECLARSIRHWKALALEEVF